jgi:hypothetical protein
MKNTEEMNVIKNLKGRLKSLTSFIDSEIGELVKEDGVVSKECTRCHIEKPLDSFHKGSSLYGRHSYCKTCRSEIFKGGGNTTNKISSVHKKSIKVANDISPEIDFENTRELKTNIVFRNYGYLCSQNALVSAVVSNPNGITVDELALLLSVHTSTIYEYSSAFEAIGVINRTKTTIDNRRVTLCQPANIPNPLTLEELKERTPINVKELAKENKVVTDVKQKISDLLKGTGLTPEALKELL